VLRRALALVAVLLAVATATACGPDQETRTIDLGTVRLELDAPAGWSTDAATFGAPTCADAQTMLGRPGASEGLVISTATPETACPQQDPLNGRFPSWGSVDQLPDDAEPVALEVGDAYRFVVEYTECTNDCIRRDQVVTFVELPDGRTFFTVGIELAAARHDAMVESIRVAP